MPLAVMYAFAMTRYAAEMPKPPRSPIVTDREKTIGVRVSPREYEAIQRRADKLGLRVASYVRLLALQDAEEELSPKN